MGDLSIELWLNSHQYQALEDILSARGEELEAVMQKKLSELYVQAVPEQRRVEIDRRIEAERLSDERQALNSREFAVYHIAKNGADQYFESDNCMELTQLALLLRRYQRGELRHQPDRFADLFQGVVSISATRFTEYAENRAGHTGRLTGVYALDFNNQAITAIHGTTDRKTYSMQDTGVAAYHAYKKDFRSLQERTDVFFMHLESKEIEQTPEDQQAPELTM